MRLAAQGYRHKHVGSASSASFPRLRTTLAVLAGMALILAVAVMAIAGYLARPAGLEPATTSLEGSCSIQLSYGRAPLGFSADCAGAEPSS